MPDEPQPSAAPARSLTAIHPKVSGAVMATAAVTLAVAILKHFGIDLGPAEIGAAYTLATGIVGYLVPGADS